MPLTHPVVPIDRLRWSVFHVPDRDLIERRWRYADPLVVLVGTARAVPRHLATGRDGVTVRVHGVRPVLGKAHELHDRSRTVTFRRLPVAHATVVLQAVPRRIPRKEEVSRHPDGDADVAAKSQVTRPVRAADERTRTDVMRAVVGSDGGRVRVVIADDRPLVRTQLRKLLDAQPDLDVVGMGWSGMEALRLVHELEPHVLVLDQDMDDVPGLQVAAHLGDAGMKIRVVLYAIDEGVGDEGMPRASTTAQVVLDEESLLSLVQAIRRPRAAQLAARSN